MKQEKKQKMYAIIALALAILMVGGAVTTILYALL